MATQHSLNQHGSGMSWDTEGSAGGSQGQQGSQGPTILAGGISHVESTISVETTDSLVPPFVTRTLRDLKNLDSYLESLKERASQRLGEFRYERKLMSMRRSNVVAELQAQIELLQGELKHKSDRRSAENGRRGSVSAAEAQKILENVARLEAEKAHLEEVVSQRDAIIQDLGHKAEECERHAAQAAEAEAMLELQDGQLQELQDSLLAEQQATAKLAQEKAAVQQQVVDMQEKVNQAEREKEDAIERLEGTELPERRAMEQVLQEKDVAIEALEGELAQHRAGVAGGKPRGVQGECLTRLGSSGLAELADLRRQLELKDEQLKEALESKRELLQNLSTEPMQDPRAFGDNNERTPLMDANEALKHEVGVLKERVAELAARKVLSGQPADMEPEKLTQAGVMEKLKGAYEEIVCLYDVRDEILCELKSLQEEVFNPQSMRRMVKLIRDREIASRQQAEAAAKAKLAAAEEAAQQALGDLEAMQSRCDHLMSIKDLETAGKVRHFEEKWRQEVERRKNLHDKVLELKGNIRVFGRIRPLLEKEAASGAEAMVVFKDEETLTIKTNNHKELPKDYEFDRIFGPGDGQAVVFEEVACLATSVLDGYNVCVMAYGQTGGGKTHTMEGPPGDPGVISRILTELFGASRQRGDTREAWIRASVLEIYNEQIVDLLSEERDQRLEIKQTDEGMHVPGLTIEAVDNMEDVNNLIARGKRNRSTFETAMNACSSRSHLVVSVYVDSADQATGRRHKGKLHLVDLAGSERLSSSGAKGERLKEAQNINKSLAALGDVVQALKQKNQHVPFRNSKLTRFLEDSLGRGNKCLLLVNFSPCAASVRESRCSAEFGLRARKVELGKATASIPSASSQRIRPKSARL